MGVGSIPGMQATHSSKLPPLHEQDLRAVFAYNLREEHLVSLYRKFLEVDTDANGVWTVIELYKIILEPRLSMRAPIIDAVFFMGDALGQGSITFQDFLVTFTSFCALTKEEMLQLLFIIVDKDRNGHIEKQELLDYFSYVPVGCGTEAAPVFPVNNKNALDKFRGGKWQSLAFDGLAQLVELFPYIAYPAFHAQDLYRKRLLGKTFWDRLEKDRMNAFRANKVTSVHLPGSKQRVDVKLPGRCSMLELLEYSRRKTAVQHGKRVIKTVKSGEGSQNVSSVTKERDDEISRCPLLSMIRNPHCMYYVPYMPSTSVAAQYKANRPEFELPDVAIEPESPGLGSTKGNTPGVIQGIRTPTYAANASNPISGGLGGLDQTSSDSSGSEGYSGSDSEEQLSQMNSRTL